MKGLHQRVGVCILTRMAHINLLVIKTKIKDNIK
jgi:hypothetical protein